MGAYAYDYFSQQPGLWGSTSPLTGNPVIDAYLLQMYEEMIKEGQPDPFGMFWQTVASIMAPILFNKFFEMLYNYVVTKWLPFVVGLIVIIVAVILVINLFK